VTYPIDPISFESIYKIPGKTRYRGNPVRWDEKINYGHKKNGAARRVVGEKIRAKDEKHDSRKQKTSDPK
jgi:hypothetical protein